MTVDGWVKASIALALALAALALLHVGPRQARRGATILLTFLAGLFYVVEFFLPPTPDAAEAVLTLPGLTWNLTQSVPDVGQASQVVGGFAFMLGVFNLTRIHGNYVRRRRPAYYHSLAFFAAMIGMVVFACWRDWQTWFPNAPAPPIWVRDTNPEHISRPHDVYTFLFDGLLRNLEATMFSILAFYIVSAAYRAFRVRNTEAGLLMVTAMVLMMGQVPLGMAATNWIPAEGAWSGLRIENVSQFVLTNINGPVQRAIGFGIGLGMLAMALRIWLSLERGAYFEEEA